MTDYHGYPTRRLSSRQIDLEFLTTAGPRIVRLSYKGSPNLFAELPENAIATPYGEYRYLGGHRLWHAPEAMPRSYIPDNDGLTTTDLPEGVLLEGKTERATGIRKRIEVCLKQDRPAVELTHTLTNEGIWDIELAPWALTMCRLGGTVILPIRAENPELNSLLPDRHLSLWPYSQIDDPRLQLSDDFILLKPRPNFPPFKIGAANPRGWIAYWLDGVLFRVSFDVYPDRVYPDGGCTTESYCDHEFVEMESLGPLTKLSPGNSVSHIETWEFYDSIDQDFIPAKLRS